VRIRVFIYLFILVSSLGGVFVVLREGQRASMATVRTNPVHGAAPAVTGTIEPRKVYPFSIVPGGVRSKRELQAAINKDLIVASHYSGVDVKNLKPVTLQHDLSAYVSFRMHGKVYWTSRKIHLKKGERIFEAGAIGVRERCGNQVSEQPQTPVLPNVRLEPTSEVLDTPIVQSPGLIAGTSPSQIPTALPETETGGSASTPVPMPGGGPVVFMGGGGVGVVGVGGAGAGGGGGGGGAGGAGYGAGGGAPGAPGQETGTAPVEIIPPLSPPADIIPPGAPPITYAPLPPPAGGITVWYTTPPAQPLPPTIPPPSYTWVVPQPPPGNTTTSTPPETPPQTPPETPPSGPPTKTPPPSDTPPGGPMPPSGPETTPVPEPSTWLMLAAGLGLAALKANRARK